MQPRIGISMHCVATSNGKEDACLDSRYFDWVINAGAVPVPVLPFTDSSVLREFLANVDGVLLSGGDDLHPCLWGSDELHSKAELVTARRQQSELMLYTEARGMGLPIMGICLGTQVIAVVEGGFLKQHIPDDSSGLVHQIQDGTARHVVRLSCDSKLHQWLGTDEVEVNSYHHQAVAGIGSDLRVAAVASDGVIEAIEGIDDRFLLGVQWHPERDWDNWVNEVLMEKFLETVHENKFTR